MSLLDIYLCQHGHGKIEAILKVQTCLSDTQTLPKRVKELRVQPLGHRHLLSNNNTPVTETNHDAHRTILREIQPDVRPTRAADATSHRTEASLVVPLGTTRRHVALEIARLQGDLQVGSLTHVQLRCPHWLASTRTTVNLTRQTGQSLFILAGALLQVPQSFFVVYFKKQQSINTNICIQIKIAFKNVHTNYQVALNPQTFFVVVFCLLF